MKKALWTLAVAALVAFVALLALRYLGTEFAALLGLLGLGGAGVVADAKKKARKKHEEVAKNGPDAVAADNLDMLRRRHNDPR